MSEPLEDVGKEVKRRGSSMNREMKRQNEQIKSAFAFDFVPGDPEGDARRAAEKATLDQKVRESASRRASRYLAPKGKGVASTMLARETLG